jgi:hypothetical protein
MARKVQERLPYEGDVGTGCGSRDRLGAGAIKGCRKGQRSSHVERKRGKEMISKS